MRQHSVRPGTLFTAMDRLRRDEVSFTDFANGCAVSRIYFTPEESSTLFREFAGEKKFICWEDFSSGLIQHTMPRTRGKDGEVEDKIEKEERENLIAAASLARAQSQNTFTGTPSTQFSLDESRISVGRRIDFDDIERQERQHLLGANSLDDTLHKNVDDTFKRLLWESRTSPIKSHSYSARDFSASTNSPHRPLATPLVHSPSTRPHYTMGHNAKTVPLRGPPDGLV